MGPFTISQLILSEIKLDSRPSPIKDLATKIIIEQRWETKKEIAMEHAEKWESKIISNLRIEINKLLSMGRPPRIAFNSSSEYMVQGACFVEPVDSIEIRERKNRRAQSDLYYDIFNYINPKQFEKLCGKLIGLIGVEEPHITRSVSDDGIDFYGYLSLGSIFFPKDLTPTIQKQLTIWLIGQAKHYKISQSGTQEIRDLAGAVMLGRSQVFGSSESPFPYLKTRVGDPVFSMLITTGTLSANAWKLLQQSGIIGMDGEMVAAFLADRSAAQLDEGNFDRGSFFKWIEE
ncbi:MAG: hypothetical protein WAW52_14235 [Methanothrix sp.]